MNFNENLLLGSIAGDVLGSVYDSQNVNIENIELYNKNAHFSKATVMSMAIADALLNGKDIAENLWDFTTRYAIDSYNENFQKWLLKDEHYNSDINDNYPLIRASSVGILANGLKELKKYTRRSVLATHTFYFPLHYSEKLTEAIYLYLLDYSKEKAEELLFGFHKEVYQKSLDDVRPESLYYPSAEFSFYYAYISFHNSLDYEDAICNAVSCSGGNSGEIATVSGALAMSYFKTMKKETAEFVLTKLPNEFIEIIIQYQEHENKKLIYHF